MSVVGDMMTKVFIGIGSNLGDRTAYIKRACDGMAALERTELVAVSSVYETDPVGPLEQGKYLNAVAQLDTGLEPYDLLDGLVLIEEQAGRELPFQRTKWGPRTLDLDILLFGDRVISGDELVVPHPMMHERWFVLKPLAELDPTAVHPLLEMTVDEILTYVERGLVQTSSPRR